MNPLQVTIHGPEPLARQVMPVLASLPRSFALGAAGEVAAVGGNGAWADEAIRAIADGARGVLVMEPQPVPLSAIDAAIEAAAAEGTGMRLARQWASNPAVSELRSRRSRPQVPVLVESHAVSGSLPLPALLVAQVDLVLSTLGGSVTIESVSRRCDAYQVTARLEHGRHSVLAVLSGALTSAIPSRATVRELLANGRTALEVHDGNAARPAVAWIGDATGERLLPTIYETGYRAALRALRADLDTQVPDVSDLGVYRAACAAVYEVGLGHRGADASG